MAAANSTASKDWSTKVMDLANAPGEPILPGELGKALELIAAGTDIDYIGASAVELVGAGESAGAYREYAINGGKIETVGFR
jgi:branched-chain amino acid transport system substrate-binding protein